ncbi:MAG: hypothetical protein WKG00_10720 [Polyangiaceae bacterium]
MGLPAAKLSVSLPGALAAEVKRRVGPRGLSRFVARAVARELEQEQLSTLLAELEAELGPVKEAELARVRREWRKR